VLPLVVWLGLMLALAAGLAWVQNRSERDFQRRFAMRATMGADFAANYIDDQVARARRQGEEYLTASNVGEQRLREVSAPFGYTAVVLLDDHGRLLQVVPARPGMLGADLSARYEHLRIAVRQGVPAVSRVVPSAAEGVPVVAFAVPFDTPRGRRVFSGALPVQDSPLGSYLRHAIALPSSRVYLIDPDAKMVASAQSPPATTLGDSDRLLADALARSTTGVYSDPRGQDWFYRADPVAGTPWRLVAAVPTAVLYAPARDPALFRAAIVVLVALAGLVAVVAVARSRLHRQLLGESEQRYRDVFDNSLIGMALTAPTRRMLRVNPAFCAMLGYTEAQMLTRTFTDITHPEDVELSAASLDETLSGRTRGFSSRTRYLHSDGHTVHAALTTALLRDEAGAPVHFATQIVDVTERTTFEAVQEAGNARLREAHARVENLVAMLSHDVRQPLGVITAYTDTVIDDWDTLTDALRRDFLARVVAAARRMTILLEDILALTTIDAGTIEPRRATIDVVQAVAEAIAQLPEDQADSVGVDLPAGPAPVVADPGHLQQILLNLIGNAAKYGSPPITVTVRTAAAGIDVTVSDHGEGVPADFVPHLFERFARATTGAATAKKGTGLGLYIVEQLAQVNHAHMSYQPNQPAGSRFTLRLTPAPPTEPTNDPRAALVE
jgi:PAS domain S-box-containing protein